MSRESLRIISSVPMQLGTMKYHEILCNSQSWEMSQIWQIYPPRYHTIQGKRTSYRCHLPFGFSGATHFMVEAAVHKLSAKKCKKNRLQWKYRFLLSCLQSTPLGLPTVKSSEIRTKNGRLWLEALKFKFVSTLRQWFFTFWDKLWSGRRGLRWLHPKLPEENNGT